MQNRFLRTFCFIGLLATFHTPIFGQEVDVEAEVEKMLEAVGGREVWKDAHGFMMAEVLYTSQSDLPAYRQYWVDFRSPRIMEQTLSHGFRQTRVLNMNEGWTLRDGELTEWDGQQIAGWSSFWLGIPTRVFYLLANNDPDTKVVWRDGVMDIYIHDTRVVWIATDEDGTPVAYGREDRHTETHFLGKPLKYGPVTLWSQATEPGGKWRVVMVDYTLMTEPHTVSFEVPIQ